MRVDAFDFDLPDDRIALRPSEPRDAARMLVVPAGADAFTEGVVADLPALLRAGDVLVVNDTRVIPARLYGVRERAGTAVRVEALLHMREGPDRWRAFARPGKRLAAGDRVRFGAVTPGACSLAELDATIEGKGEGGEIVLRFDLAGAALDDAIESLGHIPLPPYIASSRPDDDRDRSDYQTVYADQPGSVAAPTAGLHFTPGLLEALAAAGIGVQRVTLHVGAGTFLPVKVDDTRDHRMHAEWGEVPAAVADALNAARARGGRIVAVGTTSLRLLESAAAEDGTLMPWRGTTSIFITPGYRFRTVDVLMTNFHLPKSTLFMLVSAFSGLERMRAAYAHAIASGYRFYSYGDACLLFRNDETPGAAR
jgi:S-adenosylmethionine:tRNA ribosyltransferase-isomerase